MKLNHRFFLRIATDTTLYIIIFFGIGSILWTMDIYLDWDIMPDFIDKYLKLIVIVVGIAAGLSIITCVICSFSLIAESFAIKANIIDSQMSKRLKRIIFFIISSLIIVIIILYFTDKYRTYQADIARQKEEKEWKLKQKKEAEKERIENEKRLQKEREAFHKKSKELSEHFFIVLNYFSEDLIDYLEKNAIEKENKKMLQLINAINVSSPYSPTIEILIPASKPYKYCKLRTSYSNEKFERQCFTSLPNKKEEEIIDDLFRGKIKPIDFPLSGIFIDNTVVGTWGALKHNQKIVALLTYKTSGSVYETFTKGPDVFICNQKK